MIPAGVSAFVHVDGIGELESRDFAWESILTNLADQWSITVPAPGGMATTTSGERVHVAALKRGALVKFYESDPEVESGAKLLKMTGRLVTKDDANDAQGGYTVRLAGYDLGWHLTTGCGKVFRNLRGVKWEKFLSLNVLDPSTKWGLAGVRGGNLENKRTRIGPRAAFQAQLRREEAPKSIQPVFQIEVGQSVGPALIEAAKWEHLLLNVSADGWLQFFSPVGSTEPPLYFFHHEDSSAERDGMPLNNVSGSRLAETADGLFTRAQCWTSITRRPKNSDTTDPNFGRYQGQFENAKALPFLRLLTFSDPNQIGKARAKRRAKWAHDRGVYDSWTYTFRTKGHSQGGIPFEVDTIASLRDTVRKVSGVCLVAGVRYVRTIAKSGLDAGAGTYAEITLKLPDLLGA